MFKKKFKVRVRRSSAFDRECFYVEYTYHRFFSNWKVIHHWLVTAQITISTTKDREKAEDFAKTFDSIERVIKYNEDLKKLEHKYNKHYETKIIHSS